MVLISESSGAAAPTIFRFVAYPSTCLNSSLRVCAVLVLYGVYILVILCKIQTSSQHSYAQLVDQIPCALRVRFEFARHEEAAFIVQLAALHHSRVRNLGTVNSQNTVLYVVGPLIVAQRLFVALSVASRCGWMLNRKNLRSHDWKL
ncbi:hypothetical protein CYLTODRAFT_61716 [Cylindrobasidium torrendii FP15055 ss-10]|uniref:Uncharacterized protein n=1 Tax=Cylindrobasidium torrendii FP15055 ss-10 TaxID=1314674 RepID=A0A0D7B4G9_9AGAR|nr:hypothetical protein CYLTODRAFT_61716 [Cylindrobasidium torrendii FP15055 ss-10]